MAPHNWIPPLEYILKSNSPIAELEAWCEKHLGTGPKAKWCMYKVLTVRDAWHLRIYTSDQDKRMQFKLRWSDYIERMYEPW